MGATRFAPTTLIIVSMASVSCSAVVAPDGGVDAAMITDAAILPDIARESAVVPDADTMVTAPDAGHFDDLIISGQLSAYDGTVFHLALEDRVHGIITRTGMFTASAASGFMVVWPAAFDRNAFGMVLHVYADLDRDGVCSSGDATWDPIINNDFMTGHAVLFDLMLTDAGMSTGGCAAFP